MPKPHVATRQRLSEVRYEIRGELARRARELEARGHALIKLNIGNPGAFGFRAPEHMQRAIADHIHDTDPYAHQQGLPEARDAVAAHHAARGVPGGCAEDVFIGNGVSELIDISLRALLDPGDEVLLPSPDYPLWSAATILNDGRPVYYRCKVGNGFLPDPEEIEALVSARTRAIVLINPNNPTGAAYPRALLERIAGIARRRWPATCPACPSAACPRSTAPAAGGWAGRCCRVRRQRWRTTTTPSTCSARCACARTCPGSSRSRPRWTAPIPSPRCARRAGGCTRRGARWPKAALPASIFRWRFRTGRCTRSPGCAARRRRASTTTPSPWSCWKPRTCWWCRVRASTCPTATTSG